MNKNRETPLHEACKEGIAKVLKVLLETNPSVISQLEDKDLSALFINALVSRIRRL